MRGRNEILREGFKLKKVKTWWNFPSRGGGGLGHSISELLFGVEIEHVSYFIFDHPKSKIENTIGYNFKLKLQVSVFVSSTSITHRIWGSKNTAYKLSAVSNSTDNLGNGLQYWTIWRVSDCSSSLSGRVGIHAYRSEWKFIPTFFLPSPLVSTRTPQKNEQNAYTRTNRNTQTKQTEPHERTSWNAQTKQTEICRKTKRNVHKNKLAK